MDFLGFGAIIIFDCDTLQGLEHIRNLKLIENTRVAAIVDTDGRGRDEAVQTLGSDQRWEGDEGDIF